MTFKQLAANILEVLASFVWLVVGLAVLYFMWGLVKYLTAYGDEKARSESVKTISYGLIALFVIVAVWGLVELISVSLLNKGSIGIPQFQ